MDNKTKEMIRLNNKGLSLVELLVAIAIVVVVGGSVFGFMAVGAKTFSSTSSEVNIQSESQLAFNQMQDLIIDTAIGIDYGYAPDTVAEANIWDWHNYTMVMDDSLVPTDCSAKKLIMYNTDKIYEITWSRNAQKLYYIEYNAHVTPSNDVERDGSAPVVPSDPATTIDDGLMAEHITDFKADLNLMEAKRIVRVETTYSKDNKEYSSSHNITLRNKPVSGNTIPDYYVPPVAKTPKGIAGETEIYLKPGESLDLMNSLSIRRGAGDIMYMNGSNVVDSAGNHVSSTGSDYYGYIVGYDAADYAFGSGPQAVKFSIKRSGQTLSNDTRVTSAGVLTVSPAQRENFKVTVATDFITNNLSGEITVNILCVKGITIEPVMGTVSENKLKAGDSFELAAKLTKSDDSYPVKISDSSSMGIINDVDWEITTGSDLITITDDGYKPSEDKSYCTCVMKSTLESDEFVKINEKESEAPVTVKATSKESVTPHPTYPYTNENDSGVAAPVFATWSGTAHKNENDYFSFDYKHDMERGQRYVINLKGVGKSNDSKLEDSLQLTDGSTLDISNMIKMIKVDLLVTKYHPNGSEADKPVPADWDYYNDDEISIKEGDNWVFKCPTKYNPNWDYTYKIQAFVANNPNSSKYQAGEWYKRDEVTEPLTGLKSSKEITFTFKRLKLDYQNTGNPDFVIKKTAQQQIDEQGGTIGDKGNSSSTFMLGETAVYYLRHFNSTSKSDRPIEETKVCYDYTDKSWYQNGHLNAGSDGGVTIDFRMFRPDNGGKYTYGCNADGVYSGDSTELTCSKAQKRNNKNGSGASNIVYMNSGVSTLDGKMGFKLKYDGYGAPVDQNDANKRPQKWKKIPDGWTSMPEQLRIVPIATVGKDKISYVLFDSYIDVYATNIEIKNEDKLREFYGTKTMTKWVYPFNQIKVDTFNSEKCYFPVPSDTLSNNTKWPGEADKKHAKTWAGAMLGYNNKNSDYFPAELENLSYEIFKSGNTYTLKLYILVDGKWKKFARYECDENGRKWNYIATDTTNEEL